MNSFFIELLINSAVQKKKYAVFHRSQIKGSASRSLICKAFLEICGLGGNILWIVGVKLTYEVNLWIVK